MPAFCAPSLCRMKLCLVGMVFFLAVCPAVFAAAAPGSVESRLVILANSEFPDSVRLAEHYAAARGIPTANIIALPMPVKEKIGWKEFSETIWNPLMAALVKMGRLDAMIMNATDEVGRNKSVIAKHDISYLVICRGVPLGIYHQRGILGLSTAFNAKNPPDKNAASVDSELSLLAYGNYAINGMVLNPVGGRDRPDQFRLSTTVKVSRIDGPTYEAAAALVDHAIEGEKTGLIGRAYIDVSGPYKDGNTWMNAAGEQLKAAGFDTDVVRRTPAEIRFDAPVLYFGWHAPKAYGAFVLPGFKFPPGAVALHIFSWSGPTLRTDENHWTGPLIARGVTATYGNVDEPYLQTTHRPDLVVRALVSGANLGDASYYALPVLSWLSIVVGDPLYRPFKVTIDEQWARRDQLTPEQRAYVVMRKARLLKLAKQEKEAESLLDEEMKTHPSLWLAGMLVLAIPDASWKKAPALDLKDLPAITRADQWGFLQKLAEKLLDRRRPEESLAIYKHLFGIAALPDDLRALWLKNAIKAADKNRDRAQVEAWEADLKRLAPPVSEK